MLEHYKLELSYRMCQQGGGHDFSWMQPPQRNSMCTLLRDSSFICPSQWTMNTSTQQPSCKKLHLHILLTTSTQFFANQPVK